MGFSRQDYWSGLPCLLPGDIPNLGIEPTTSVSPASQADSLCAEPWGDFNSEKVKVWVTQSCPTLCDPMDCSSPGLSMEFSRPEYWSGLAFLSPGDLPNPGIKPRSPTLQADSLPAKPPGKPSVYLDEANLDVYLGTISNLLYHWKLWIFSSLQSLLFISLCP